MNTDNTVQIARVDETRWQALADGVVVGHADVSVRPDRRHFVSVDVWDDAAFEPLAAAMLAALPATPLRTLVEGGDTDAAARWERAGFVPERREWEYVLSTAVDLPSPAPDVAVLPAGTADEGRLRVLDREIRAEVAAGPGWHTMPAEVRPGPPGDTLIDPSLYAVAVHQGRYAGLVRVVRGHRGPARIGLLAVRAAHRRHGLGRTLLAHALHTLHESGTATARAEVDQSHAAATALFEGLGAQRAGHVLQLIRD
ncbi:MULTISPECIES: GNAT family N-acetyltransferase [Kitasatospora]|uniref:Putative acetyltransferase n=1 Tax=Kitasatospora setae (strain ATCC 33774 / DSM 43861 / JCM 3304 / KCC A-0304 / NBRC 14216 / KM-6054) TaxID=452652 RepID=E4NIY4_KITSK|nr:MULTISPECIES: GNAT family N-acetyltransferase [Kitasatospora]BAJ32932.1 putative acetyltransferase [Kitasatospora setae KM-6054]